jgi:plastocyanin
MNTCENVIVFVLISTTALISVADIFPNIFAQPVVKEILIGPDPSRDGGDDVYNPDNLTIIKGNKVTWLNNDFGIHTVTENQGLFSSEDLRPDETFEYTFDNTGTYNYHCKLHPEMTGKIIVN